MNVLKIKNPFNTVQSVEFTILGIVGKAGREATAGSDPR